MQSRPQTARWVLGFLGPGWLAFPFATLLFSPVFADEPPRTTEIRLPSGTRITAEVAGTPARRTLGLMFREHLPEDRGMLFVFESSDFHGIWMKNCRIALDILWLDRKRRVVHIEEEAPPCGPGHCPSFYPARTALYVLELNAGMVRREDIRLGQRLDFQGE